MPLDPNLQYWIARSQQTFGPYSLVEIDRYVRSGNILPSDYLRSEHDAEWTTVGLALGIAAPPPIASASAFGTAYGTGAGNGSSGTYDAGSVGQGSAHSLAVTAFILAGLGLVCCSIFTSIPGIVIAAIAMNRPPASARTMAVWALVVNILVTIFSIISFFLFPILLKSLLSGMNPGGPSPW